MTQKHTQTINPWTHKHDQYCLENKITPSAKLMWQWLLREGEVDKELEPDLKEFNKWVCRHRGKPYCRNTLKTAFEQLVQYRVIRLAKQFTWNLVRIVTRTLEDLLPKKKLRTEKLIDTLPASNLQSLDDKVLQQQHSDNLALLCDEGFEFDEQQTEVLNHPKREVQLAVLLFKIRGGFEKIRNPEGWIRTCLRYEYWEQPRNFAMLINTYGQQILDYFEDNLLPVFN